MQSGRSGPCSQDRWHLCVVARVASIRGHMLVPALPILMMLSRCLRCWKAGCRPYGLYCLPCYVRGTAETENLMHRLGLGNTGRGSWPRPWIKLLICGEGTWGHRCAGCIPVWWGGACRGCHACVLYTVRSTVAGGMCAYRTWGATCVSLGPRAAKGRDAHAQYRQVVSAQTGPHLTCDALLACKAPVLPMHVGYRHLFMAG